MEDDLRAIEGISKVELQGLPGRREMAFREEDLRAQASPSPRPPCGAHRQHRHHRRQGAQSPSVPATSTTGPTNCATSC